jgi:8-oxo-dGTP pyrophosphatase MutT (NUDIX family)
MNLRLPELLAARLMQPPLPGREAQRRFEPALCYGRHFGPPTTRARAASVLVLLYPHEGDWRLPLTVRPATLVAHAGQISLPGGSVDPGETGPQAALRELEEELGVSRAEIELLGGLSPLYVFVSEFLVTPWVAVARERPAWAPSPFEVAELLELPLAHLLDPANQGRHARRQRGVELSAPHFLYGRHRIWGATSMILAELAAIIKEMEARG